MMNIKEYMRNEKPYKVMTYILVWTLLFSSLAFGQQSGKADSPKISTVETPSFADYLIEVSAAYDTSQEFARESQKIARILTSGTKNPILIDNQGYARDMVLQSVANRLATLSQGKKLFRINWNALFSTGKDQAEINVILAGIIKYIDASKGKVVIYLDDIASFSSEMPVLGEHVAGILYNALSQSKIQILSASDANSFEQQIAGDNRLRSRFERIDIARDNDDGFVGDKLSPDLRALVAGSDQNKVVKVILQSDDINNPQLLNVLSRNGVSIENRATSLNMLIIDLPVRVAEEVAAVQGAKHLSLDKEIQILGHVETTTGVSLVRTQTTYATPAGTPYSVPVNLPGGNPSGSPSPLPTGSPTGSYQLDGSNITVAVLDSGIYEQHHMFMDAAGTDRVIKSVNFAGNSADLNYDPYGHGSHVAGILAGSTGRSGEFANYRNIAPNAKMLNVRVLDQNGTGTTAGLIQAIDWVYANRSTYNIKVVNMSLGTAAIESYRNDPLCRAARRLVDAGIVVVAAAGNNGKNEAGEKLYGAIHSPGNEPSVITVGATNTFQTDARDDDGVTTFSSRGPTRSYSTDLVTGEIKYDHLMKPDLVAPGNKIVSAVGKNSKILRDYPELKVTTSGSDDVTLMQMSGTSMSTPMVSGTAALLLQANPKLTQNMVKMLHEYTAQQIVGFNVHEQ